MAWTTPRTWATNELVTADMMNEQLRDNLSALKSPPGQQIVLTSDQSTTSTTWVDMPGASISLTTSGGNVLALFTGVFNGSTVADFALRIMLDSAPTYTLAFLPTDSTTGRKHVALAYRFATSPGSHTLKLQWLVSTGTLYLRASTWAHGIFQASEVT